MALTQYAGFWLRFVAYIVDYIILQVIQSIVILPVLGFFGFTFFTFNETINWEDMSDGELIGLIISAISAGSTLALFSLAIAVVYYTLMEASKYQGTVGKIVLNLQVTDMDGRPLDVPKAFLRQIGKIVSGLILMIGYIMAGFTEKKQALHDMMAGALVVKK